MLVTGEPFKFQLVFMLNMPSCNRGFVWQPCWMTGTIQFLQSFLGLAQLFWIKRHNCFVKWFTADFNSKQNSESFQQSETFSHWVLPCLHLLSQCDGILISLLTVRTSECWRNKIIHEKSRKLNQMKVKTHQQELFNVFEVPNFWKEIELSIIHMQQQICHFHILTGTFQLLVVASKWAAFASGCCCIKSILSQLQRFEHQSFTGSIFPNPHTLASRFTLCLMIPLVIKFIKSFALYCSLFTVCEAHIRGMESKLQWHEQDYTHQHLRGISCSKSFYSCLVN